MAARVPDKKPAGGWVYILTNPAFPHLVKVGCTGRTPEVRAAELSSTGVPQRFSVAWAAPVSDYARCEKLVHDRLDRLRSNQAREFFRCDVATARQAIEKAAQDLLRPWWWRLLFLRPSAAKPAYRGRYARRSSDRLLVAGLLLAVAGGVALLKPAPARWMPAPVVHVLALLEGRQ